MKHLMVTFGSGMQRVIVTTFSLNKSTRKE